MKLFHHKIGTAVLCALLSSSNLLQAASPHSSLEIALMEAEQKSLQNSERLKAALSEKNAARLQKNSQASLRWPKLNLEASYRYIGIVPALGFQAMSLRLGDNDNYSIGPSLNWTVWDSGTISQGVEGLRETEDSKNEEARATERIVLLNARQAYFKVQLALEQQRLVADSLHLAQAQYRDIENRWKAGTASKIDSLSAHKEVLNLTLQFRQTQAELSNGLRDLFSIMGEKPNFDFTYPIDTRIQTRILEAAPLEGQVPTAIIGLEPIEKSLLHFENLKAPSPDESHPQIQSLKHLAQASRYAAESTSRKHWPRLDLVAKSSLDYPNGPVLEQIHQNTFGIFFQWNLFDASQISHEAAAKESQADAVEHRKQQLLIDLTREWNKAQDQLKSLKYQRQIFKTTIAEAEELEKLVYSSYLAGRSNFLDVQSANLRALESKVESARNNVQILMQLAALAQLAGKGTSP